MAKSPYFKGISLFFCCIFKIFSLKHTKFPNISPKEIVKTYGVCAALHIKSFENGHFCPFTPMKFSKSWQVLEWCTNIVLGTYTADQWQNDIRMSKSSFDISMLYDKLFSKMQHDTCAHQHVSASNQLDFSWQWLCISSQGIPSKGQFSFWFCIERQIIKSPPPSLIWK